MNKLVFFVLLQVLISAYATPVVPIPGVAGIPKSLRFIGTISGKSYFADNATKRSWTAAKAFCTEAGMRLATITSSTEATFPYQQRTSFNEYHWVGGRDLQTIGQFAWDHNSQIVQAYGVTFSHGTGLLSCLRYRPDSGTTGALASVTCTTTYAVLCEIAHG